MSINEHTAFVETFGSSPLIRVLDFFLTYREFDYPLTEIAENTSIGWNTLSTLFPKLLEKEIVIETRRIGRARLYKLNQKNSVVQKLIEIDNIITNKAIDDELKDQKLEKNIKE